MSNTVVNRSGGSAVITGAASGIGLGLAREGMRLAIADVEAPQLEAAATELRPQGATVFAEIVDVSAAAALAYAGSSAERLNDSNVIAYYLGHLPSAG